MSNTILTNVMVTVSINIRSTVSISPDDKRMRSKMDCYILHTFVLVIILLFIIAIIYYHYTRYRSKQKRTGALTL